MSKSELQKKESDCAPKEDCSTNNPRISENVPKTLMKYTIVSAELFNEMSKNNKEYIQNLATATQK